MTWTIITQPETKIPNQILEGNLDFLQQNCFSSKTKTIKYDMFALKPFANCIKSRKHLNEH